MPLDVLASGVSGLASAHVLARQAFAVGVLPPVRRTVAEWAAAERVVSNESGSPFPGRWLHETAPYLIEPMEVVSLSHPATEVNVRKAAQLGFTEVGLNLLGQISTETPASALITLPSLDSLREYIKLKLQPMIDATPLVKASIREQKSRDEDGSTTQLKKFPGGTFSLTTAASSRGLQMKTVRVTINEEVTEYPFDVDGRGDPLDLSDARTDAWSGREKKYRNSTPGIEGQCRITKLEAAGDQRRFYPPCPHCGDHQQLYWDRLIKEGADRGKYPCASCGVLIEERHKPAMLRARGGRLWLKCFEGDGKPPEIVTPEMFDHYRSRSSDGRQPSFAMSGLYSPFKSWTRLIDDWDKAKGIPSKEKTFFNQGLGEPYKEKGEAPDFERLFERRLTFPWRTVPKGAVRITAAADVQKDRIEYAVYAWGIGYTSWRIDAGVIVGNPSDESTWRELDKVFNGRYPDIWGRAWQIDAMGVDTGYATNRAYNWVRRWSTTRRAYALDGRGGWKLPALGKPVKRTVSIDGRSMGKVLLWPVGTWDMKSELYAALRKTIEGADQDGNFQPGVVHFNQNCTIETFKQITAEHLKTRALSNGLAEQIWFKEPSQANEEHDMAVYARALVHHLTDSWSVEFWTDEAQRLGLPPDEAQQDILRWLARPEPQAAKAPAPSDQTAAAAETGEPAKPASPPEQKAEPAPVNARPVFFRRGSGRSRLH